MDKNTKPAVLLVNCCTEKDHDYLSRGIFNSERIDFEKCDSETQSYRIQSLRIDNKYYTALVNLFSSKINLPNSTFENISDTEALIFAFELRNNDTFNTVKAWVKDVGDREIGTKLLLATDTERCSDLEEKRKEVLDWCIENSFELVECFQTDDNDEFPEKFGFERISEALHTHIWPNMIEKTSICGGHETTEPDNDVAASSKDDEKSSHKKDPAKDSKNDESQATCSEMDMESFEQLFSKLNDMKESAKGLSDADRKEYAEKTAIAFWKAMGLDEDEISGL